MRVLVTGAQGFVGRSAVASWLRAGPDVEVIGVGRSARDDAAFTHQVTVGDVRLPAPLTPDLARAAQDGRVRYRAVDLLDRAALAAALREAAPTIVVHLASGLRDDDTERLLRTNALGTENLYLAIAASGIAPPSIVVGSSGSVYGAVADDRLPVREDQPPAPFDMYSISKVAQESVARTYAARLGFPTTIARMFAIVGPGQDERHVCGRLASQIAAIEAGGAGEMSLGPLTATRDFVDVRDAADALVAIALRGEPGASYNVASGRETPVQAVYDELIGLARLSAPPIVRLAPPRPLDMPRNVADVSRLAALGVAPRIPLRRSLADVLDYYRGLLGA